MLKLRALVANDDLDRYWAYHLRRARTPMTSMNTHSPRAGAH